MLGGIFFYWVTGQRDNLQTYIGPMPITSTKHIQLNRCPRLYSSSSRSMASRRKPIGVQDYLHKRLSRLQAARAVLLIHLRLELDKKTIPLILIYARFD